MKYRQFVPAYKCHWFFTDTEHLWSKTWQKNLQCMQIKGHLNYTFKTYTCAMICFPYTHFSFNREQNSRHLIFHIGDINDIYIHIFLSPHLDYTLENPRHWSRTFLKTKQNINNKPKPKHNHIYQTPEYGESRYTNTVMSARSKGKTEAVVCLVRRTLINCHFYIDRKRKLHKNFDKCLIA